MATPPFGIVLETALKHEVQGGKLLAALGGTVKPAFYCCISGNTVGVAKDPVAHMDISARRVCTMVPITVTYSGSWSPSCTINNWTVDWGDGNFSTGGWPGAGSVVHPGGGYAIPATYHVVLTVTDLLGATGTADATVEVIDCTPPPPVLLMGGCGSSGPHVSANAGITWTNIGGGVIDNSLVYDLKANLFTVGFPIVEVWTTTENGLYKGQYDTVTGGIAWKRITLPEPEIGIGVPFAIALCPSRYDRNEFLALALSTGRAWLYRTGDGGTSWNSRTAGGYDPIEIGMLTWESVGDANDTVTELLSDGTYLYASGAFTIIGGVAANHIARYDGTSWHAMGAGFAHGIQDFDIDEQGTIRVASPLGGYITSYEWTGSTWVPLPISPTESPTDGGVAYCISVSPVTHDIAVTAGQVVNWFIPPLDPYLSIYSGGAWTGYKNRFDDVVDIQYDRGGTLWRGGLGPQIPAYMRMVDSAIPGGQPDNNVYVIKADPTSNDIYAAGLFENIGGVYTETLARHHNGIWSAVLPPPAGYGPITALYVYNSEHIIFGFQNAGVYKHDGSGITLLGASAGSIYALSPYAGHTYAGGSFHSIDGVPLLHIGRTVTVPPVIPVGSWPQMIDMSADGQYVYVAALTTANRPLLVRVRWDLSDFDVVIERNAGTYVGVACDPYFGNRIWAYGDLGVADKVWLTDDWGITWANTGSATWGAGEVVGALLPSFWDTGDVVAVLNSTTRLWQTKDYGASWTNLGATAFVAGCGARDYWEPLNLWLGKATAGANHLQYSPNAGVNWIEHSGGFAANAPVNALQVIG